MKESSKAWLYTIWGWKFGELNIFLKKQIKIRKQSLDLTKLLIGLHVYAY